MTIGERIRERRKSLKISQKDLAKKSGVRSENMYKYEAGIIENIPHKTLELIARHLYVSPSYLMGWEDEELSQCIEKLKLLEPMDKQKVYKFIEQLSYR